MKNKNGGEEYDIKDLTHGLIVVNPIPDENDMLDILHFVGYWSEPTEQDALSLRIELGTDEELGLTEMIDDLDIIVAPDDIVEYYKDMALDE